MCLCSSCSVCFVQGLQQGVEAWANFSHCPRVPLIKESCKLCSEKKNQAAIVATRACQAAHRETRSFSAFFTSCRSVTRSCAAPAQSCQSTALELASNFSRNCPGYPEKLQQNSRSQRGSAHRGRQPRPGWQWYLLLQHGHSQLDLGSRSVVAGSNAIVAIARSNATFDQLAMENMTPRQRECL